MCLGARGTWIIEKNASHRENHGRLPEKHKSSSISVALRHDDRAPVSSLVGSRLVPKKKKKKTIKELVNHVIYEYDIHRLA